MSDDTPRDREPGRGTDEIIELIKDRAAAEPDFAYRDYRVEDYVALGIFWVLALVVFSQFFTRYFLRFSMPWTEEGARYLLVCVTFTGAVLAVRRNSHIFVEFLYRYLPRRVGRALVTGVDLSRIAFMVVAVRLGVRIIPITMRRTMVTVPIPLGYVYLLVTAGFVMMLFRSGQIAYQHWKNKYVPACREERVLPSEEA